MNQLGKLVGFMTILVSIGGSLYYYYQGDLDFLVSSGYEVKIISNSRWNTFIVYTKDGVEKTAWMFDKNNKTYEFDYEVTSVSVGWDMDSNPPQTPFITVEIYKGKKLVFSETVHKYDTIDWNSGIRSVG